MIYIKCHYCNEKIYTLENKHCTYCGTSLKLEIYQIKKIQDIYNVNKKIKESESVVSEYENILDNFYNESENILDNFYNESENEVSKTINIKQVIILAITLMVIAVLIPILLALIEKSSNIISGNTLTEVFDPSIITLLTVLIPIVSIIGIVIFFIPISRRDD